MTGAEVAVLLILVFAVDAKDAPELPAAIFARE